MRVVVVEDNPMFSEHLQRTLRALPGVAVVKVAETEGDAVQWLDANPGGWELAVVDLFLKQGHGFAVLRHCAERAPHQRAVVLTSYTREPVRECAQDAGADAVFDKLRELDGFLEWVAANRAYVMPGAVNGAQLGVSPSIT